MTAQNRRQLGVLAVLVVVLLGLLAWQLRAPAAPAAGRSPSPAAPARGGGRAGGDAAVADVRIESLQRSPDVLAEAQRDPFRFRPRAVPAPPPLREEPEQVVDLPPVPVGPPPLPPIQLRYIGVLGAATQPDRVAVLSDVRGNPVYGREGDIIEGRYRLLRISNESVDVAYADGRGRQTLRLSAQ